MAQDAELKLKVSLDLAYFRAQLSRLPIEVAGYSAPINLKINQKSIADQYRLLNKYFGKKEFRVEVNSNLESEIKNAGRLVKALQSVQKVSDKTTGGLPLGTGQLGIKKPAGGLGVDEIRKLFNAAIQAGLLDPKTLGSTRAQMVVALGAIGRDSIEGLLNGLESGNAKIRAAAESLGKDLIATLKTTLRSQSPSQEMFDIGEDAGKGFELGLLKSMELAEQSATRKMRRMLDRLARMALMMSGMSPAAIGQQAAGFRGSGISAPSWPATAPPGLAATSGGSRILAPAPAFRAVNPQEQLLRGSDLGDLLDPQLKEVLRNAANAFVDQFRSAMNSAVRQTRVEDLGTTIRGALPPGAAPPSRPLLPAAGGTGGYFNAGGRRPGGGFVPPGGMPSDGAAQLYPRTFIGAGSSMEKFKTAIDIANTSIRNFRASSIPLIGGLKEIGGEFLNATKQVLLYGTAYKGLAFVTSLPGQILNAAKSQQQFNNAMRTATQDTGTFAKEMLYVDNIQRAFGLNLETTRQGFVRLYASMAPTGFDSGSIEKLFTGISAATAALQLTPDKAERVIYAFGQMASKGQIMSEELKGQLGDVLPGALAIFAKAAGMSVKEFSQAMEDGEFVGQRFREVFAKVSDELMNRFGTGAQAAGKSLQGLLNTVQGDFQRTLESFAPLANAAAQAILVPLSSALKQLSMAAQVAMGEQDRATKQLIAAQKDVQDLSIGGAKPEQIRAAQQNVAALQARLETLNLAAKDPAIAQQAKNIQAFVGEVSKAASAVMNIAGIIGNVLNPVMTFLGTNLSTVITVLASFAIGLATVRIAAMTVMGALTLMNIAVKAAGAGSVSITALSSAFSVLGISASSAQIGVIGLGTALRVLLVSTGIGALAALVIGLGAAFSSMGDNAKKAAQDAKNASQQIKDAALSGNVSMLQMQAGTAQANVRDLQTLQAQVLSSGRQERRVRSSVSATVSPTETLRQQAGLLGVQLPSGRVSATEVQRLFGSAISGQQQVVQNVRQALPMAMQRQQAIGLNQPTPLPAGAAETKTGAAGKSSLEGYYSLEDQLAKAATQAEIDRIKQEHQHRIELIKAEYDLREARANSFQKEALAFERKIVEIDLERQSKILEAANAVKMAQGGVVRAGGATGPTPAGIGMVPIGEAGALPPGQNAMNTPIGARVGAGGPRRVGGNERRDLLADQQRSIALTNQSTVAKQAEAEASRKVQVALEEYKAAIMPTNEQRLQNSLLQKKNELIAQSLPDSVIQRETKLFETQEKVRYGIEAINNLESEGKIKTKDAADARAALNERLREFNQLTIENIALQERQAQLEEVAKAQREIGAMGTGLMAGFYGSAAQTYESQLAQGKPEEHARQMAELETQSMRLQATFGGIQNAIGGIGSAFGTLMTEGIASMVQGTATAQEVFSQFLNSIGQALQQAAAQMIATYVAIGIARIFAGMGASPMGLEGATKAAGKLNPTVGFGAGTFTGFAKGGVALGGFKAFADGGVVNGPTLGLVGEGKYNEAIVPLPDGRAIPVQMQGDSVRDKMNGSGNGGAAATPMLSMNFETTTINNVEYVSREQLEKAMMETRKLATRDGARQGANLAIDKIQQSPNTRRRIGI